MGCWSWKVHYFSIVDVVQVLTDSVDATAYWRKLKLRLKVEGSEVVTICHGLDWEINLQDFLLLHFRHNLRAKKLFVKKIHPCGKSCKHYTFRVLYVPFYPPSSSIFGVKPLLRRRFLQHYYRDTFIESYKKPTDVLVMSYGAPEIYRQFLCRK